MRSRYYSFRYPSGRKNNLTDINEYKYIDSKRGVGLLVVMYPSLFFGEPSRAELFTQRAEPSRALWFQKPSQNEPDFFLRSVDTEIKAKILNFMISIGPQEIFAKISISQVPRNLFKLIMTRSLYLYSKLTQIDLDSLLVSQPLSIICIGIFEYMF